MDEHPNIEGSESSHKVVYAAIAGNLAIAACKYVVAAFTRSPAMLAEAIHSTVDTGNELLLLFGITNNAPSQPGNKQASCC
jgi:divalent metal cation (Fe/Co/Zn/Cd) transporter